MIKTYNIDGIYLLKQIKDNSIDFILTDPPYELDLKGGSGNLLKNRKLVKDKHIEYIANGFDYEKYFNEFLRVLKIPNLLIFCSNKQISKTMSFFENKGLSSTLLIWLKTNPIPTCSNSYLSDTEYMVYIRGKGATFNNTGYKNLSKVFKMPYPTTNQRIHPTEKPLKLLRRILLNHTKENDIVLDTFAGSFSTAIACLKENRQFIGTDNDKEMYSKAVKRINNYKKQTKLF